MRNCFDTLPVAHLRERLKTLGLYTCELLSFFPRLQELSRLLNIETLLKLSHIMLLESKFVKLNSNRNSYRKFLIARTQIKLSELDLKPKRACEIYNLVNYKVWTLIKGL